MSNRGKLSIRVLMLIELLIIFTAFYIGVFLRVEVNNNINIILNRHMIDSMIFSFIILTMMYITGLYSWKFILRFSEILIRIFVGFTLGIMILASIFYIFPNVEIWRSILAIAVILALAGILVTRFVFGQFVGSNLHKRDIVVVGTGAKAAAIEALELNGQAYQFNCKGFVQTPGETIKVSSSRILNVSFLANLTNAEGIDEIVIAVEDRRNRLPLHPMIDCRLAGIGISDYQSFCEKEIGRIDLEALSPSWFYLSEGFPGGFIQDKVKRGFDITLSIVLIIILFPIYVCTAAALWIENAGPVLYRQTRIGFRGREFTFYKFRSMRLDAEKDGIPRWAKPNDNRITTVGAFIRKSRIDEIPQIFNVLKGDMSFVGPRPERPYFVKQLSEIVPYYSERHCVKPGITGWAQVNFRYTGTIEDTKRKLEYDLYYIKNYRIFLDFIIILQTIRVVLWMEGSY